MGYDASLERQFLSVVMFNASAAGAVENAQNFRQIVDEGVPVDQDIDRWSDIFTVTSSETRGVLTITRLDVVDPDILPMWIAYDAAGRSDSLFAWSGPAD